MNIFFVSFYKRYKKNIIKVFCFGCNIVFIFEMEKELVDIIKKMVNLFYGCILK